MRWKLNLALFGVQFDVWTYFLHLIVEPLDWRVGVSMEFQSRKDLDAYANFPMQKLAIHIPTFRIELYWMKTQDISDKKDELA
jgi:hypothetical protein